MFPLNLLEHILKNASLGLKNIGRENNNGIRLMLKLEFGQGNCTLCENPILFLLFSNLLLVFNTFTLKLN
jgi:hypothetical protein